MTVQYSRSYTDFTGIAAIFLVRSANKSSLWRGFRPILNHGLTPSAKLLYHYCPVGLQTHNSYIQLHALYYQNKLIAILLLSIIYVGAAFFNGLFIPR